MTRYLRRQQQAERDRDQGCDEQARPRANKVKEWVSLAALHETTPGKGSTVASERAPPLHVSAVLPPFEDVCRCVPTRDDYA